MNIKKIKINPITNFNYCKDDLFVAPRSLEKRIGNKFVKLNDENLSLVKQIKISDNESVVLKKKESKFTLKTLRYLRNDSGKMRHFTPAAQE